MQPTAATEWLRSTKSPPNFQTKGETIEKIISALFNSGLYIPAGFLLAGWMIAFLVAGWPMLLGLPVLIFSIYVVVQMFC
jgi:hypothetical protein